MAAWCQKNRKRSQPCAERRKTETRKGNRGFRRRSVAFTQGKLKRGPKPLARSGLAALELSEDVTL